MAESDALHVAAGNNRVNEVRYLMEGEFRGRVDVLYDECTPLEMAISGGNIEAMRVLLEYGADYNRIDGSGCNLLSNAVNDYERPLESFEILRQLGLDVHRLDNRGCNLLVWASTSEMIRHLIVLGLDPNHQDNDGNTALHHAAKHADMIQFKELSLVTTLTLKNNAGQTPTDILVEIIERYQNR